MKLIVCVALGVCLVGPSGCMPAPRHGGVISPLAPVIATPDKTDFGFCGGWRFAPDPIWGDTPQPNRQDEPPVTICMKDDGTYSVVNWDAQSDITCRALPLDKAGFALVEAEVKPKNPAALPNGGPDAGRFLLVAKQEGESLFIQAIHSEDLALWMAVEGYAVEVAAPGFFGTAVDAEPDELLECVRKHWSELCNGPSIQLIKESREPGVGAGSR